MRKLKKSENLAILFLLLISVLAEIFVFNFRFFEEIAAALPSKAVGFSQFAEVACAAKTKNGLLVQNGSTFYVKGPGAAVNSVKINASGSGSFTVAVYYTDEAFSNSEISAGSWDVDLSLPGSEYIRLKTAGNCKTLKFVVYNTAGSPVITSIELNRPYFKFRLLRCALLFLALFLLTLPRRRRLWDTPPQSHVSDYAGALINLFFAAAILSAFLCAGYGGAQTFSADAGSDGDCYRLLTEAFANGRLSFLESPPQALKELPNPYDPTERANINYIFDSAYFNGKYYCYFGIAPVITLLLPFRLLTGLYMPTPFACFVYMLAMLFAVLFLYYNIAEKWFPDIGCMPFVSGAIAVVFGANLFWLIARPMFYELAVISALFYLFLGFALLIRCLRGAKRPVLTLVFSGLCFALMVASRPTFIFYLAAAVPLLLPLIFRKQRLNFKNALGFFSPLAVFAVILIAYNYARFGSPFDFGQRYQLTISDIRYNKATNLAALPGGLYHYFFAPLSVDLTFPFFHIVQSNPETSAGFYYNQPMAGLFNFPLMLTLFCSVYIIKRMPEKRKDLKAFTSILLVAALVMTYIDITLAGVLERYTLDIGPVLTFVCVILWFEIIGYFRSKGAARPVMKAFFALCLVTAVISTLCCSVGEYNIQIQCNPRLYEQLEEFFEFWR